MRVLDLFSAAAGGWSLGMHRAGFKTVAACENVAWRRALYQENNPNVLIYDNVCTVTADRIIRDVGYLPQVVVGSPPCQDISSANTKGKGVEGARSGLYFEAIRIIGEVRPRWFALENSANLRTRGADAVLAALEALGYTCQSFVVGAGDIGANHERKRSWLIGCDIEQITDAAQERCIARPGNSQGERGQCNWCVAGNCSDDGQTSNPDGIGRDEGWSRRRGGIDVSVSDDFRHADCQFRAKGVSASQDERPDAFGSRRLRPDANDQRGNIFPSKGDAFDATCFGHEGRWARRHRQDGNGSPSIAPSAGNASHADQAGQADGCMVTGLRQAEIANDGRGIGRGDDGSITGQVGLCEADRSDIAERRADWSLDDLAHHLRLDAGLSEWVAGTRIAVGGPKGTSAASLIVEAFGDSVLPQIPEAIGRAILRTETALRAIYARAA